METEQLAWVRGICSSGHAQTIREAAGVSRGEVARDADCAEPTIWRWERGLRTPKGDAALRYAKVMRRLERLVKSQAVPA